MFLHKADAKIHIFSRYGNFNCYKTLHISQKYRDMETLTAIKLPISHENIEIWRVWGNLWGLVHYHFIDEEPRWVTYAVVP